MKKLLFTILLVSSAVHGFSQTYLQLWGGAGLATSGNYDMGISQGINFFKGVSWRTAIGAQVAMQGYNIYYNKEVGEPIGSSLRNKSTYLFVSPMIDFHLRKNGHTHAYLNAGVGFNMGAEDSLRRWSYTPGGFDSTYGSADNVKKMVVRIGMGLTHYIAARGKFRITVSEDVGFLATPISKTTDPTDVRLYNNSLQFYKPMYISLRLGIGWRFIKHGL